MILGLEGFPETCNWLECTMETDASIHNHMSTDEMYMVLQSDMVNIKQQEQALQTEIVSIKNKFLNLLQHCGLEDEFTFTPHHVTMATASDGTTTASDRSTCNLHYSYADFLIEQLLASASGLTDSDLSPSPEESRNEFDTPGPAEQVEPHNSLNSPSSGVRNRNYDNNSNMSKVSRVLQDANIKVLPNMLDSTTSENCVPSSASSDSYPLSTPDDLSDNQVVPDLDLEKELISRVKYYSDFTIDRQRKINELLNKSKNLRLSRCRPNVFPGEDISERKVEGAESRPSCIMRINPGRTVKTPSSSTSSGATSSSGNGTLYRSKSKNKTSSSRSSRTSSHPLMSSTLIYEPTSNLPSSSTSGDSVYTWSIDENSEPGNLEQSYLRSRNCSQRNKNRKPNSNMTRGPTRRRHRHQSSALHLTGLVSIIEPASSSKKVNCTKNMCDDDLGYKSQTLPRTSTRINLFAPDTSCSMPNVSAQQWSDSSSPLHERTDLPGKSSTSEGSNGVTNFGFSTMTSMMVAPNVTECSRFTTEVDSSLIDSILTDSPKSVDSSGIFAPYNSPHASSLSSQCGYTTVSSSIPSTSSNDYCDYRGPLPTPATVKASDPIFKIPHSPIARSKTCRRKSSIQSPSVRTSTPRPFHSAAGSARSAPVMRRKLFELNNNGQKTGEPRILDKKAIVRKFKKFSHHFKKDHTDKIKTLANL